MIVRNFVDGHYITREVAPEEINAMQTEQRKAEAQEKHRPLSFDEVNNLFIKQNINTLSVDDATAVRMTSFYPTFEEIVGQTVKQGFKFTYKDKLYKVIQPTLTILAHYPPIAGTESMYEVINEQYDGDMYDPIPYDGNMALENGKYYTQNGVTYLCNRDTGNAVFNPLADLVGLYVEVVE